MRMTEILAGDTMGKDVFPVGTYISRSERVSVNLDVDSFLEAIDNAPSEEIGVLEAIRLNIKMAKLMKKAKKL